MASPNSTKIFVGSIPKDVTEDELRAEASKYGNITQIYYVPATSQNLRGWAFITYEQRSEAYKAIESLDCKCVFSNSQRPLDVRFASNKNTNNTYDIQTCNKDISNQPPEHGSASLPGSALSSNGSANIGMGVGSDNGLGINTGSVIGGSMGGVTGVNTISMWQKHLTTDNPYYYNITNNYQWEKPKENYKNNIGSFGPPGANVFIFHLPSHWTDMELFQHFQHFGFVVSAKIQRDANGRNKGYGFVSFNNPESALNAIRGMHGFYVSGKHLKVQIKKGEEHYIQLNNFHNIHHNHNTPPTQLTPAQPYSLQPPQILPNHHHQQFITQSHMINYDPINSPNHLRYNNTYNLSRKKNMF